MNSNKSLVAKKAPKGTEYTQEGRYYKEGAHGRIFYHDGFEWVRCQKTLEELRGKTKPPPHTHYWKDWNAIR